MDEPRRSIDPIADRFARWCETVVAHLPFGLDRLVPPTFLGFALINSGTFGVDLALLTLFRGGWGLPIWLAVTMAYLCALAVSFVLNRTLNFHSHAPVGRQAAKYLVVIAINYFAFLLGVGSGLTALGVEYHLSRLLAGACEAVFIYGALRWVVFRGRVAEREPEFAPDMTCGPSPESPVRLRTIDRGGARRSLLR